MTQKVAEGGKYAILGLLDLLPLGLGLCCCVNLLELHSRQSYLRSLEKWLLQKRK